MPSTQSKPFVDALGSAVNATQFGNNTVTSHGTSVKDAIDESLSTEALRIECKRMDHELSMAHAANKRLKYKFKEKTLVADHKFRLKKIEADEGATRLEALKLRIELERFRASQICHVFDTGSARVPTSGICPAHLQEAPSNPTVSENISVSFDPHFSASCPVFTAISPQLEIVQPSDVYDLSQTSFGIPLSPPFNEHGLYDL